MATRRLPGLSVVTVPASARPPSVRERRSDRGVVLRFQNVTTCPVDRQPFSLVLVRREPGGPITRQLTVDKREARDEQETEDPTYCEVRTAGLRRQGLPVWSADSKYVLVCVCVGGESVMKTRANMEWNDQAGNIITLILWFVMLLFHF